MNLLRAQSRESKLDGFKKYKHQNVFEADDQSFQHSGGEDDTNADFAINQSSEDDDDSPLIFQESESSKEEVFQQLKQYLKKQKQRKLQNFDNNLLKSFVFNKSVVQENQNIQSIQESKQDVLNAKIDKFTKQQLVYKDYKHVCNYNYTLDYVLKQLEPEKESELYYNERLKELDGWIDYLYPNANGTKNRNCTQFYEIEKNRQRYLLVNIVEQQGSDDERKFIYSCNIMSYDFKLQEFNYVTTQLLDIIPRVFTEDDLTQTRVFINQKATFIYKKQEHEFYGFQLFKYLNKDIKQETFKSEYIELESLDKYKIEMPEDINIDLDDFDIGFMQKASKEIGETLEEQFVIVQTHNYIKIGEQVLLIYSLKDTSKPIVKYTKGEFYKSRFAFFTKKDEKTFSFIIMSGYASSYYVIDYKEAEGLVYADSDIYSVQTDNRIVCEQNYSVYQGRLCDMQVQPLEITVTLSKNESFVQSYFINYLGKVFLIYPYQEKLQRQKVIEFIQNKHKINGEDKVFSLYFNNEINYLNIQKENDKILEFLDNKGSKHSNINTHRIFTEDLAIVMSYQGIIETFAFNSEQADGLKVQKIENYENKNPKNKVLSKTLVQFDCSLQHEVYQHNYALYTTSIVNQYINSFYINKKSKGVSSTHNECYIGNKTFKFDQSTLVIDLSSVQVIDDDGQFQLIELYSQFGPCKQLKLVKYFVTQKSVIFFFLYRKDLSGFYFMVAVSLKDLLKKEFIVDEDSEIIYFENNKNILIEKFNSSTITTYQAGEKYPNFTKQQLIFEVIKDHAEQTQQYIPFILHSRVAKEMFDHYFCWMDADKLCMSKPSDTNSLDFNQYIVSFKIDYYQRLDEPNQFELCTQENAGMRMDVLSKGKKSQNMFTRSSNWTQEDNKLTARYMVATNIKAGGIESIEFKEFIVHLDFKDMNNIQLKPIQLKHLTFNEDYVSLTKSSQDNNNPIENNRLIPKIDDNGNITGVLALISNQQYLFGIHKITSNIEYLKQLHQDQENILKLLIEQVSQNIYIQQAGDYFEGYLSDGTFIKGLNWGILTQEGRKFVPAHVYYSFDITDHENDFQQLNSIQNDIVHMNVKKNQFGYLSTVKLSEKAIKNKYFNSQESNYWLYQFSKTALTLRMSLGFDYLFEDSNEINYQILQPQYKLNGKSQLFQILQDISIYKIEELLDLIQTKDTSFTFLINSVLYCSQDKRQKNPIKRFADSMDISHNYELKSDMLNLTSIIQSLYQMKKSKELKYLIKQIVQTNGQENFSRILVYELPCLMMNKFEIHEFLDIDFEEDQIAQKGQNNNQTQHLCNLEMILKPDHQIKDFGQQKIICSEPQKLENVHFSKEEIFKIIKEFKQKETKQNTQVEYSYIDFTHFCRQMNVYKIQGKLNEIIEDENLLHLFKNEEILQCSQLFLSSLINFYQDDPVMFQQNTIQALIDSQFQSTTRPMIKQLMYTFFFGFVFTFAYNNISENMIYYGKKSNSVESDLHFCLRVFFYLIAALTQLLFGYLEIIEMKFNGLQEYFQSGYNIFDFSQPFIFIIHLIIKIYIQPHGFGTQKVIDNFIQILIILGAFSKMLQFIRYKEQYCIFVNIFNKVLEELQPFIITFFVFTLVFGFVIILMQADVDNEDDDYKGMSILFESFLQVFRTSLGDLKIIRYSNWNSEDHLAYNLSLIIIWLSWIFNLLVMQIIMLNLVIAQVGQTFEKVMSQGKSSIYIERASLNQQILQILFYFGQKKHFLALILQKPADNLGSKADEFTTFSERIKKTTQKQIENLQKNITFKLGGRISDLQSNLKDNIQKSQFEKEILQLKQQFSKDLNQQKENIDTMKDDLKTEIDVLKNDNQLILETLNSIKESLKN